MAFSASTLDNVTATEQGTESHLPIAGQHIQATMGITDTLKSVVDSVGNPNREAEAQNSKVAHEHVAMGGAGMSDHEQPQSLYDALHGDSGLRNMKAHGNIASGHDAGLGAKATAHQVSRRHTRRTEPRNTC